MNNYTDILQFWFEEIDQSKWWAKDSDFDELIVNRFADAHSRASRCELYQWRQTSKGRLAEIIVLDQFSRNMFRDTPMAFASDPLALALAQEAISASAEGELNAQERSFLYMPFMHSESRQIHAVAASLFKSNGIQSSLNFELKHKAIIDRFGRYPHRNRILDRQSTKEELGFLKQPNSGF